MAELAEVGRGGARMQGFNGVGLGCCGAAVMEGLEPSEIIVNSSGLV
jgi:hypothetical protein